MDPGLFGIRQKKKYSDSIFGFQNFNIRIRLRSAEYSVFGWNTRIRIDNPDPTPPAPNENNLQIRINGIKEYTRKKDANGKDIIATQDEILSHDSYEIEKVLNHLREETNCIADLKRLGKFDKDKQRPRTILVRPNNTWTARKLLAKAKQLKAAQKCLYHKV